MNLFSELKRRNVFRVAVAYGIASWLLLQVGDLLFDLMGLPDWALRIVLGILLLGLPVALGLSWVYELTPDGLRRESEIPSSQSITAHTGRRLDLLTIGMIVLGVAFLLVDRYVLEDRSGNAGAPTDQPQAALSPSTAPPDESAAPAANRSIAVLPFVNMSADPENEYFADGLSEELLNQLAQLPDLQVAGRTSSFSFKGKNEDLRAIGNTLGVANVLEGSVRRQGNQVRVTAQLIRVADGFHLWSNTYDRLMEDVFAIQDDIAINVASAMKIILDDEARERMLAAGVRNVDAFVAYQKGYEAFIAAHGDLDMFGSLSRGIHHFDEAIALVPEFGAAYWLKADYYAHGILRSGADDEQRAAYLAELRQVLDAAYEYSSSARRAFVDVDRVLFSDDWSPLADRIERALAVEGCPDPTWIQLAEVLGYADRLADMWDRLTRCEPLNLPAWVERATVRLFMGEFETALARFEETTERFGMSPWLAGNQQKALLALGRHEEALALADEFIEDREFYGYGAEALPLAYVGSLDQARAALERWIDLRGPADGMFVMAAIGDREAANRMAAEIDARPAGPFLLLIQTYACFCGSPFDLDATPNLKARLAEAKIDWPPFKVIDFPAKDW